jgi:hypothetical protein
VHYEKCGRKDTVEDEANDANLGAEDARLRNAERSNLWAFIEERVSNGVPHAVSDLYGTTPYGGLGPNLGRGSGFEIAR